MPRPHGDTDPAPALARTLLPGDHVLRTSFLRWLLVALQLVSGCAARPLEVPRPRSRECRRPDRTVERHAWTDARAEALERSLRPRISGYQDPPGIRERLDSFASDWRQARRDACRAAHDPAFGARAACQNAVLEEFDALVTQITSVSAHDRETADAGVDELVAALARCERPAVLALHRAPELASRRFAPELARAHGQLAVVAAARARRDGRTVLAEARKIAAPTLAAHVRIALAWGTWLERQAPDLAFEAGDLVAVAELAVLRLLSRPDGERGEAEAAAALAAVRTAYGDKDIRLIEVHRELARRRRLAGAFTDALVAVQAALAIYQARDSDDETLLGTAIMHDQGELEHLLGDFASAEISHRAALHDRELLVGDVDLLTAESQHALANTLEAIGRLPAALALYTDAAVTLRAVRPDSPLAARTYNNIGRVLYTTRQFAEARRFHARALEIRQRHLGVDHPDTTTSLNNLGAVARAEGDLAAAHALFAQALEIRERVLGPDHPYTAISLNNLAEVLAAEGHIPEAVALHERALAIRLARFGPDHPETARSQHNLGVLRLQQGDRAAAVELLGAAAKTRGARLGPHHPETLRSLEQLRAAQ